MRAILEKTRASAQQLLTVPGEVRSKALFAFAGQIRHDEGLLLSANQEDLKLARGALSPSLLDRLKLDSAKLAQLAAGTEALASMPDQVGEVLARTVLDEGLTLEKIRVPLGVIAVIFESRPDVLPQIASLAIRSGNAVVLKGGSEAENSNRALFDCLLRAVREIPGFPPDALALIHGREMVRELIQYPEYVDLVVPRGSKQLVQSIMAESRVPVLGHAEGVCHIFVERSAELAEAAAVILDAKAQYPAACNAVETVLVDEPIARRFLSVFEPRAAAAGIVIKGCPAVRALSSKIEMAAPEDWSKEYGNLTLNMKSVSGTDEAIEHVNRYGSHHTDAILSRDAASIDRFLTGVDSASVFANCSTRFADGYRYGLGAEVGIGTGKIHARGPVGIEGLMTYKYVLRGNGQVVADYVGEKARSFLHRRC